MRAIIFAAVAALTFASFASAGSMGNGADQRIAASAAANTNPVPPFKLDSAGRCRDGSGKYALLSYCTAPAQADCRGRLCGDTCVKATDVCHKPSEGARERDGLAAG